MKLRSVTRNVGLATATLSLGAMVVGLTSGAAWAATSAQNATNSNIVGGSVSFSLSAGRESSTSRLPIYRSAMAQIAQAHGNEQRLQQLMSIPVKVVTSAQVTPQLGGDPVMIISQTEYDAVGIPIFKWEANQGFSDNGTVITSVAPLNDSGTSVYYPGWSLSNFTWGTSQPATGVGSAQTNANFIFSYSPLKLITIETANVNVQLHYYGDGYWTASGTTNFS